MDEIEKQLTEFEEYEEQFNPLQTSRAARRQRPRKKKDKRNGRPAPTLTDIHQMGDSGSSWVPSYAAALDPLHHERRWVIDSVAPFYRDNLISDVTRLVKGGKEANVYVCTANTAVGLDFAAAKLYRPRMLRHLKNDAIYKAGRQLRDETGKQIKGRRVKLALRKKTNFGKQVDIMWWINNEYSVQKKLHDAGADVPEPIAHAGNAILMEFIGGRYGPAPTLNEINLEPDEAGALFRRVMDNVALMLDLHHVHGDLSAYNILYWEGAITLIDFPQMVDARHNPHAFELLKRDITRVCDYFGRFGVTADPVDLTLDLWRPYMGRDW